MVSYWISIILIEIVNIVIVVKKVTFDLLATIIEVMKVTVHCLKTVKRSTIFAKVIPIPLIVRNIAIGYHDTSLSIKVILLAVQVMHACLIVRIGYGLRSRNSASKPNGAEKPLVALKYLM